MGIGIKFLYNIVQFGGMALVILLVVWLSVKLLWIAVKFVAPKIGLDAQEILSTMRGWLPRWLKRKRAVRKYEKRKD